MFLLFSTLLNLLFPIIFGFLNKEYINLVTTKYNFKFISKMVIKHSVFYMFIGCIIVLEKLLERGYNRTQRNCKSMSKR